MLWCRNEGVVLKVRCGNMGIVVVVVLLQVRIRKNDRSPPSNSNVAFHEEQVRRRRSELNECGCESEVGPRQWCFKRRVAFPPYFLTDPYFFFYFLPTFQPLEKCILIWPLKLVIGPV